MVSALSAVLAMALLALAEWLHARRVRRVAYLAFGPRGAPRGWTALTPLLRVAAVGAIVWGLVTLLGIGAPPLEAFGSGDLRSLHHVVVALDVSPSMDLPDAGPKENESRGDRARDVIRSVLERLDARRTRTSIIAFYTTAKPVVVDTFDPEVTANVLADLPLEHAFAAGKTDLYSGVREAGKLAKEWRERSATLLIVSDGDTLPSQEMPTLSKAYSSVLVLGVGSPSRGTFIDGHSSRQDAQSLERLALRLGGKYYNATSRHLPSEVVTAAAAALPAEEKPPTDLRWLAVMATCIGSLVLALLPPLLTVAGTGHRPWAEGDALAVPTTETRTNQSRELLQTGA
jgi:Ca-activated chloride channel family protein